MKKYKNFLFVPYSGYSGTNEDTSDGYLTETNNNRRIKLPHKNYTLLRMPFTLNFGSSYFDDVDYLVEVPELTDIIPRCTFSSTNNVNIHVSYRLVKVKN